MDATFALTQPVLPANTPTAADLLLTFRADAPGGGGGAGARPPVYVSVVIDRSGSMSGKPLKHALAAAELLVRSLRPQDVVSVVVYDDSVDTIVDPQAVGDDADAICKALRKVKTAGATNLHGGWIQGCKHVLKGTANGGGRRAVRRVLLLTDGQANIGIQDPKKLIAAAREQAERGVVTTTLGFGRSFNEDLLIGMAEAAGGNFYYIETPEDAGQVFLIEGESLTSVAGQNLAVTLTPAEGVRVRDVLNNYPSRTDTHGVVQVQAGDVYGGEDKLLAVELDVAPQARAKAGVPLVTVTYAYDPVGRDAAGRTEARLAVAAPVAPAEQARAATPDPDVVRQVTRIRIARAKEAAVVYADAGNHAAAADVLRRLVADLRARGLEEDFETAEEMAQLEHFAETIERKQLDAGGRKVMRDQSYQGRTRSRADLAGRGTAGGSAKGLETADTAAGGVELRCVKDGGKLRVQVVSDGYDPHFNVQFPRSVREEGVRYVVDRLETSKDGTFYRAVGKVRRLTGPSTAGAAAAGGAATSSAPPSGDSGDPLGLAPLFAGGGEPWVPLLKPVIEAQPNAAAFIGPGRDKGIVPVRELTFQALKPNPPERWKVVIFGQNPYPRVESATGIAMFDNTFGHWKDSQFGKVTSIRCIIKAATMWKHGIPKQTGIADIRGLLAKEQTVQPPEWFQAMLTQGVLLLNAALTAASDGSRSASTDQHTAFWRPVVERIVEEILKAKQAATDKTHKGVVFAWWGAHAKNLRRIVETLQKTYPGVPVRHIEHPNPAAQGDIFCDGHHFADVNAALRTLDMDEVDWLPSAGWNKAAAATSTAPAGGGAAAAGGPTEADRMGDFIARTMELHKFYLDRLAAVKDEGVAGLPPVVGVLATPVLAFGDAVAPLVGLLKGLDPFARRSADYARQKSAAGMIAAARGSNGLSEHEIAAVYLYTCESVFYKQVNAALRDADREKVRPFFPYLRLLFSAFGKLKAYAGSLWRGVAADLRPQYPKGGTVTWWGVSSCTSKLSVAMGFMGSTGKRTLFEITPASAVGIKHYSAFTGEEEYLMPPGTQLKVTDVKAERSGLYTVKLEEVAGKRLVS